MNSNNNNSKITSKITIEGEEEVVVGEEAEVEAPIISIEEELEEMNDSLRITN